MIELLPSIAVVLLGFFVLGVTGFGSALIIVPLLAWRMPLPEVVTLALMLDIPATMLMAGLNFKQVAWREIPPLLIPAAMGGLFVLLVAAYLKPALLLLALGAYVAWVAQKGLRAALAKNPASVPVQSTSKVRQFTFGGLIGVVETLFGTAGPVVMAWLVQRINNPQVLRATMPASMILFSVVALVLNMSAGTVALSQVLTLYLWTLPACILGVLLGQRIGVRLSSAKLRPLIFGLLLCSAAALIVRGILLL